MTPLHIASVYGNSELLKLLLAANAKLNITNNNNETALYAAISNCNLNIVHILLEKSKNTDIYITSDDGYSLLHAACHDTCSEIVRALLKEAKL